MSVNKSDTLSQRDFTVEDKVFIGEQVPFTCKYSNVAELLLEKLNEKPDFVGQLDVINEQKDTFADMKDRIVKCALWLKREGVKPGDIVAVCCQNNLNSIVPCVAALCVGAIFNPWDPNMNASMARYFLTLSEPKILFVHGGAYNAVLEAIEMEKYDLKIAVLDELPGTLSFYEILQQPYHTDELENFRCVPMADVYDTAVILYSSGTTGLPKGVQLSHFSVLVNLLSPICLDIYDNVPLWFSSIYWISGVLLSFQAINFYTTKFLCPAYEEEMACKLIEKYQVTWLFLGTSMANRLARSGYTNKYNLSSLKRLVTGGAVFTSENHADLKRCLPHVDITQMFGMTELGGIATGQKPHHKFGSIGTPGKNVQLKIIDVETHKPLGPNQTGEFCLKTLTMMTKGYYKNPQATKETIDSEGWLHSGDLAYYDDDGEFFIYDRMKEIIKYRGYQISPSQIENLLRSHPGVNEVAVLGLPHPTDDEHPIAFIVKIPSSEVTEQELMDMVATNMMDHQKLRGGVVILSNLSYTPSGKIDRKKLREMAKKIAERKYQQ